MPASSLHEFKSSASTEKSAGTAAEAARALLLPALLLAGLLLAFAFSLIDELWFD